jgi:RNA polymerase sigma-70 factor (ECF subfamily)
MNDEEELLRRCARGDAAAYRELVDRVEKPLVNFILRFVGERHVAEDLFQETFVRIVKTLGTFRPEASLAQLSPIKREALVLRMYAGLQYSEIARIQGAPVGTVKFRIHEAVKDLSKLMGAEDDRTSAAQGG